MTSCIIAMAHIWSKWIFFPLPWLRVHVLGQYKWSRNRRGWTVQDEIVEVEWPNGSCVLRKYTCQTYSESKSIISLKNPKDHNDRKAHMEPIYPNLWREFTPNTFIYISIEKQSPKYVLIFFFFKILIFCFERFIKSSRNVSDVWRVSGFTFLFGIAILHFTIQIIYYFLIRDGYYTFFYRHR